MTGLLEAMTMLLVAACVLTGLGSVYYVLWFAFRRPDVNAKVRSVDGWVKREARWGLLMASPLLFGILAAAARPGTWWWASLLGVIAIGALYAIPVLAIRGVHMRPAIRWFPTAFVLPTVPVLIAISAFQGDWFGEIVFVTLLGPLGIGYVAGCMVAVRFARAVGRRDPVQVPTSVGVAAAPRPPESAFIWPA